MRSLIFWYWETYFWAQRRFRLHIGWRPWILIRAYYGICWDNFLRVKRCTDKVIEACPCSDLTWDYVGVVEKQTLMLGPNWGSQHHGGVEMISTERVSLVVSVIVRSGDYPSVLLWSPALLCVCNDKNNFWVSTKKTHQGWREG